MNKRMSSLHEYEKALRRLLKGKMSEMLRLAIKDAADAVKAGDLRLAYHLTACKSFVVGTLRKRKDERHAYAFRESRRLNTGILGASIFQLLDGIHHDLAYALDEFPSGMVIYRGGPRGWVVEQMSHKGDHPVIERMKAEEAEIKRMCEELAMRPVE